MTTRSGLPFRGKLTDNERDTFIEGLLRRVHTLETDFGARIQALEAFAQLKQPDSASVEAESSAGPQIADVIQPTVNEANNGQESIHDFLKCVLSNQALKEPPPPPPKGDDTTKKVKLEVSDLDGQWNPSFFYDWLTALEDHIHSNWPSMAL